MLTAAKEFSRESIGVKFMISHKCPHIVVHTVNYNKFTHMIGSTCSINRKVWFTSTAAWYLHIQIMVKRT
jgi:hypothetical protein